MYTIVPNMNSTDDNNDDNIAMNNENDNSIKIVSIV